MREATSYRAAHLVRAEPTVTAVSTTHARARTTALDCTTVVGTGAACPRSGAAGDGSPPMPKATPNRRRSSLTAACASIGIGKGRAYRAILGRLTRVYVPRTPGVAQLLHHLQVPDCGDDSTSVSQTDRRIVFGGIRQDVVVAPFCPLRDSLYSTPQLWRRATRERESNPITW